MKKLDEDEMQSSIKASSEILKWLDEPEQTKKGGSLNISRIMETITEACNRSMPGQQPNVR